MHDLQAPDPHGTRRRDLRLSSEVQPKGFVLQSNGGLRAADQRLPFGNAQGRRTIVRDGALQYLCGTRPAASATTAERRLAIRPGRAMSLLWASIASFADLTNATLVGSVATVRAGARNADASCLLVSPGAPNASAWILPSATCRSRKPS